MTRILLDRTPQGVVFASIKGETTRYGDDYPFDYRVTLMVTDADKIVGVTLDGFADMPNPEWLAHKVRVTLPVSLVKALDDWFALDPRPESQEVDIP